MTWIKSPAPEPSDRNSDEWWTWYLRDTCPWCGQVAVRDDVCTVCLGRKSRPPSPWTSEARAGRLGAPSETGRAFNSCPAEAPKEPGAVHSVRDGRLDAVQQESVTQAGLSGDPSRGDDKRGPQAQCHAAVTAGETAPPPHGSSETLGRLGSTTKSAGSTPAAGTDTPGPRRRTKKESGQGNLF